MQNYVILIKGKPAGILTASPWLCESIKNMADELRSSTENWEFRKLSDVKPDEIAYKLLGGIDAKSTD